MIMKNDNGYMKSAMLIGDPGLGAFQESHRINVGVLLLDPDSEYPNHCHYQEEVYQDLAKFQYPNLPTSRFSVRGLQFLISRIKSVSSRVPSLQALVLVTFH